MSINSRLALTLLAGVAIGLAAGTAIHAQQTKAPPAFVVAEPVISDMATFQKYAEQVPGTFAPFGGHYLIRGGKVDALDGDAPKRFVVIAFDSAEKAHAWEDSPAYLAIKPLRLKSAQTRDFIVEGVPAQ
jgi:uncharacterized protein (DUF1330 family)